ncbi:MAG: Gfo/Idh/MocA family oxidoreductase [Planctomycetota bacterium]
MARKRYAQVGVGGRSKMYTKAICEEYSETCEIVALCDTNKGRMELKNRDIAEMGQQPVPMYDAADFDRMVAETKPDYIIVTTVDATHHEYLIRGMELGCDVITEKPMTTDEKKCQEILRTVDKTGRNCQVTFNYRYAPHRSQVKEILDSGRIGEILSVDFTWPLDTRHGADYFRRWHRNRDNSGSLLVHKATHHFDLVNWWIADEPEEVFCHGCRTFYVPATADRLGLTERTERCTTCPHRDGDCPFVLKLEESDNLKEMYLDNEDEDGYFRDRCVFGEAIDIWDNMSVSVKYAGGAVMNYFLHTYSPWEGYQIAFNGSQGRIEHGSTQFSYISGEQESMAPGQIKREGQYTTIMPHFKDAKDFESVEIRKSEGGHGGGDPVLLADIFAENPPADPLHRKANQYDGAMSILVGIAGYHSIDQSKPVRIPDLLDGAPLGQRW